MFTLNVDAQDDLAERVATLESIVDAYGLAETISALAEACDEKAEHIRHNWQDEMTACLWGRMRGKLATVATEAERHKLTR